MEKVVQALQNEGIRSKVKLIIGDAPVRVDFVHRIGADAHGKDAAEAVLVLNFDPTHHISQDPGESARHSSPD